MQNKRFIFSPLLECREIDIRRFRRVASPFEIGARSHILIEKATHREEEGIALRTTRIVETLMLISRAVTRKSCLLQGHPTAIDSTRPLVRIVCLAVAIALHGAEVLEERVRSCVPGRGLGATERGNTYPRCTDGPRRPKWLLKSVVMYDMSCISPLTMIAATEPKSSPSLIFTPRTSTLMCPGGAATYIGFFILNVPKSTRESSSLWSVIFLFLPNNDTSMRDCPFASSAISTLPHSLALKK